MYYGFDIGGTKIALGAFDKDLKLQWETRVPTPRESYDEFLTAIAALVSQADERFGGKGSVGIGIPGMPETDDGTLYAANVPAASGKPLRADLSALLERDVRLDNDANCFALSEPYLSIVPIAVSPSIFAFSRFTSDSEASLNVMSSRMCISRVFASRVRLRSAR